MNALTDFKRPQGGRRGGVRRLWLARAADVETVAVNGSGAVDLSLREGAGFAAYEFAEDTACYTEKWVAERGVSKVVHELSFVLPCIDHSSGSRVAELSSGVSGVVAIIETEEGVRLLAGYSEGFGIERPLRFAGCSSLTGQSPADVPQRTVILRSEDTSAAMPCETYPA